MSIDSKYLEIEIDSGLFMLKGRASVSDKAIEIWDDGDIAISLNDDEDVDVFVRVEELEEIVRVYKLYRDRRDLYLATHYG